MGYLARGLTSLVVVIISVILGIVLLSANNVDAYRRGGSRYYRSYRYSYYSRYYYYRYYGYSTTGSSSDAGIIAGAVVGSLFGLVLIGACILLVRHYSLKRNTQQRKVKKEAAHVTLNTPQSVIEKRQELYERKGPEYFHQQPPAYNNLYGQPPPPGPGQPPPGAFSYQASAYPPPADPAYPPGYVPK
ncbi:uncharacterized protein LOC133203616 [Saccostrea echinata]|uniref:uncharacterized protein LOC133203616 n=1 Tax=Saccostrea echinata TaxID=191078 RepID=UPI002A7F418F|nr:uncharacterized protein LOC133203616 [Saccostrea echinata]